MSSIRVYNNAGSLSEGDLGLLANTDIIINMMRNRIIITTSTKHRIDWLDITNDVTGFYHIRNTDARENVYQLWFEHASDMEMVKQKLMIQKLSES